MRLEEMIAHVAEKAGVPADNVEWYAWPHVFPSTAGPRGSGGNAMTTFQVYAFDTGANRYKYCSGVWRTWSGEFQGRW